MPEIIESVMGQANRDRNTRRCPCGARRCTAKAPPEKNRTPTTDARRPSSDARSTALRASADIPALAPAPSTRFLFTRGSPSALSAACLFAGPMYAASSFCRLRAWFRGRELDDCVVPPAWVPCADILFFSRGFFRCNGVGVSGDGRWRE